MSTPAEILQMLSAASLGLLMGALLTEGCVFVPHWRSLPADAFHSLYKQMHPLLYRFFTPTTVLPLVLSFACGIASVAASHPGRWFAVSSFGLCLALTTTHEIYFKQANTKFANASLEAGELAVELRRWKAWHWVRTAIGLTAFALAIVAIAL